MHSTTSLGHPALVIHLRHEYPKLVTLLNGARVNHSVNAWLLQSSQRPHVEVMENQW